MKLATTHEPVRLSGWAALAVGLLLLTVIGLAAGAPIAAVVLQVASVALASIGGLEFARSKVIPTGTAIGSEKIPRFDHWEDQQERDG